MAKRLSKVQLVDKLKGPQGAVVLVTLYEWIASQKLQGESTTRNSVTWLRDSKSATGTIQPACWLPGLLTFKEWSHLLPFHGHPYRQCDGVNIPRRPGKNQEVSAPISKEYYLNSFGLGQCGISFFKGTCPKFRTFIGEIITRVGK